MTKSKLLILREKLVPNKTVLAGLLIGLIFLGALYYQRANHKGNVSNNNPIQQTDVLTGQTTPAPLTIRQKQQLSNETSPNTKQKIFDILGGNFYYSPYKITVNQGDNVVINFVSQNGMHDFLSDPLKVRTPLMREGQLFVVKFTADKKGSYEFYSDFPLDKKMGMKGILIVQ